jgi:hypothetical protein
MPRFYFQWQSNYFFALLMAALRAYHMMLLWGVTRPLQNFVDLPASLPRVLTCSPAAQNTARGVANTVKVWRMPRAITNVISASAGPKTCSHEQRK